MPPARVGQRVMLHMPHDIQEEDGGTCSGRVLVQCMQQRTTMIIV